MANPEQPNGQAEEPTSAGLALLQPGAELGPYHILEQIGAGGMGEVYKARDIRLDRNVAIKVLPAYLSANAELRLRFEREARAVAALSHPNILAIHDFGNYRGVSYAVMEFLEGQTLRARLKNGAIAQKETVGYGLQIARGLTAAHEKGIVHRDLKPENLFVCKEGHLKILDFGLARMSQAQAETGAKTITVEEQTRPGTVMGTVGYMSPEQARGLTTDARSDIFSFGAVLYEMLSGTKAFARDSVAETMSAILRDEPPNLPGLGGDIAPGVARIMVRCLEKDPERRFQSARELAQEIEQVSLDAPAQRDVHVLRRSRIAKPLWLALAAVVILGIMIAVVLPRLFRDNGTPKVKRIVIFPFEDLGGANDVAFTAGISEEINDHLKNVTGLTVISRTTATGYNRKGRTAPQIAADLSVDYILEGTVRWDRSGEGQGRVRIAPRLILAGTDTQVWAERYERVLEDRFAIQSEVAEKVVKAMGVSLLPHEKAALGTAPTRDPESYGFYMRGLEFMSRGETRQNFEGAIKMYQAAVDRDPGFVQALAELVKAHCYLRFSQADSNPEHLSRSKESLSRLETIGPGLAETHIARAWYAYYIDYDYARSLKEFSAARALQPSNTDPLEGSAYILRRQDKYEEAADLLTTWTQLDPRNATAWFQYAITCSWLRRFAEGERGSILSLSINPKAGVSWSTRGIILVQMGNLEKADAVLSEARRIPDLQDGPGQVVYYSFRVALMRKDITGALRIVENEKRERLESQFYSLPVDLLRAEGYALAGDHARARSFWESALRISQRQVSNNPNDGRYQSSLSIALAALGRRDQALEAAVRATELMPVSKDALKGRWLAEYLAQVQTMIGQYDAAIDQLDALLARPFYTSTNLLRLEPRWAPLRQSPRFAALLAKYERKP